MSLAERMRADASRIEKDARDGLARATRHLVDAMREAVGIQGSPGSHSRPGEPPRRQSGRLQDSIEGHVSGDEAVIRCDAPYADLLEHGTGRMAPRPFFDETIEAEQETVRRLIFGEQ